MIAEEEQPARWLGITLFAVLIGAGAAVGFFREHLGIWFAGVMS